MSTWYLLHCSKCMKPVKRIDKLAEHERKCKG